MAIRFSVVDRDATPNITVKVWHNGVAQTDHTYANGTTTAAIVTDLTAEFSETDPATDPKSQASVLSFTADGDIAATLVESAIMEVRDDADTKLAGKSGTGHGHTHASLSGIGPNDHHTPPTALPPNGSASGDLAGSYPSPTLDKTKFHVRVLIPVWNHTGSILGGGQDTFAVIGGGDPAISGIEEDHQVRLPKGNLIAIQGSQDGNNSDCTLTARVGGSDSLLTALVTSAGAFARFRVTAGGPVAVADGALLSLRMVTSSGSGMLFRGLWVEMDVELT